MGRHEPAVLRDLLDAVHVGPLGTVDSLRQAATEFARQDLGARRPARLNLGQEEEGEGEAHAHDRQAH